jgi:hypothetical protein
MHGAVTRDVDAEGRTRDATGQEFSRQNQHLVENQLASDGNK